MGFAVLPTDSSCKVFILCILDVHKASPVIVRTAKICKLKWPQIAIVNEKFVATHIEIAISD